MSDALNRDDLVLAHDLAGEILELGSSAPLDRSSKKNWVENSGGLPPYVREVAREIEKSGKTLSQAIAIAISRIKKWAATGKPETKAKAIKALAQWEAAKAKNKAKKAKAALSSEEHGVDLTQVAGHYWKGVWVAEHVDSRPSAVKKAAEPGARSNRPDTSYDRNALKPPEPDKYRDVKPAAVTPAPMPKKTVAEWAVTFHDHSNDKLEKRRLAAAEKGDHEHVEAISAEQARRATIDDVMARHGVDADIMRITDFELRDRFNGLNKGVPTPRQDIKRGDWVTDVMGPHQITDEDEVDKGPSLVNKLNKPEWDRLKKELDRRARMSKRPEFPSPNKRY